MIKEIYKGLKIDFHPASFIIGGSWIDEYAKELGEIKTFDFIYKNVTKHKNPVFVDPYPSLSFLYNIDIGPFGCGAGSYM